MASFRYVTFKTKHTYFLRNCKEDTPIIHELWVDRLLPYPVNDNDYSNGLFLGISSESQKNGSMIIGKLIAQLSNLMYLWGYSVLFLFIMIIVLTITYFISFISNGQYAQALFTLLLGSAGGIVFLLMNIVSSYIEKIILIEIPLKNGWVPIEHLREVIEKANT